MRIPRGVGYAIYLVTAVCVLLVLAELGARWAFPRANTADTDRTLFDLRGDLVRWHPRASGTSFGRAVHIDEFGFRDLGEAPATPGESWLLLGDSVTFGVGVDARDTFAGRLQAAYPSVKIWNTAVVGYSLEDYWPAAQWFFATFPRPTRVLLVFCLNDPMERQRPDQQAEGLLASTLGFLRRHSTLYIVAKGVLTDRSQAYFRHDLGFYDPANPRFGRAIDLLGRIQELVAQIGVPLLVVVVPYEYQLREATEENRLPQRMLAVQLAAMHVDSLDLYDAFAAYPGAKDDLFLYGDPMHLSVDGHALVYAELTRALAPN